MSFLVEDSECMCPSGSAGRPGHFEIASAKENPTVASFTEDAHKRFGEKADELLKLYPAANDAQARRSAQDLAGDRFIAFSTWKCCSKPR